MLFTSLVFLFYFLPLVLLLYGMCGFSRALQNIVLLSASLLFYAWGEPVYVFLMMGSIIFNYVCGLLIGHFRDKGAAKWITAIGVVGNAGILFYFKYLDFVIDSLNALAGREVFPLQNVILPIGISFFTFQAVSYIVDVCRGTARAEKNLFYLGLYIALFPQLIAGPIVKFRSIANQLRSRKVTLEKFSAGVCRFSVGFCKKILIANNCAVPVDYIYGLTAQSSAGEVPALLAWLGAALYMIQIYFDFAAYSDMAIGLGLMFGFLFEENFNYPYISKSIGELWRRWHISLTSWFREYVYYPLGGSRVENQDIMVRNLLIVWLLTGLWHGADWTFLLWGLLNFFFILMERFFDFEASDTPDWIRHVYTLSIFCISMVFFRADNMKQADVYLRNMFCLNQNPFYGGLVVMILKEFGIFLAAGAVCSVPIARRWERLLVEGRTGIAGTVFNTCYPLLLMGLVIFSVSYLMKGSYNPFIYFNF